MFVNALFVPIALVLALDPFSRATGDDLAAPPRADVSAPMPHARQLALGELEWGVLVEYGLSTVAGVDRRQTPTPLVFHPDELDAKTWAAAARDAGARLLVLTVREPSGFCLWPSAASSYHVGMTPWRDGRGDLVREVVEACRTAGLAVGFKLSAADLSAGVAATPGRPGARSAFGDRARQHDRLSAQLRELCIGYGPLALIWIEEEHDPFGWDMRDAETGEVLGSGPGEALTAIVRELQPGAAIVGTPFPDVRLLPGDRGFAPDPLLLAPPAGHGPRMQPDLRGWLAPLAVGRARDPKGKLYDTRQLEESWLRSVGAGATWLLQLDIDREGHVPAAVRAALEGLGGALAWRHAPHAARDLVLAWANARHPMLDLGEPRNVDRVVLAEDLALGGQRVRAHLLEAEVDGQWKEIARGTSIGRHRVHALAPLVTQRIRLRLLDAEGEPVLAHMSAHDSKQP